MVAQNAKSLFLEITDAKEGDFEYTLNPPNHRNPHAAAERMLEALTNLENDDGAIPPSAWMMVQDAIERAGGTPKGPPETDIRAENAALRQSLAWAINTFQGESGLGDNYWEQFPEYVAACALVADTNVQPEEADTDSPLPCDGCYWEGLEAEGTRCEKCEADANAQPEEEAP